MGRPRVYPHRITEGAKFGRLRCLGPPFRAKVCKGPTQWHCVVTCDCGAEAFVVNSGSLLSGLTRSCGCLKREVTGRRRFKHGGSGDRLFRVWADMTKPARKSAAVA